MTPVARAVATVDATAAVTPDPPRDEGPHVVDLDELTGTLPGPAEGQQIRPSPSRTSTAGMLRVTNIVSPLPSPVRPRISG